MGAVCAQREFHGHLRLVQEGSRQVRQAVVTGSTVEDNCIKRGVQLAQAGVWTGSEDTGRLVERNDMDPLAASGMVLVESSNKATLLLLLLLFVRWYPLILSAWGFQFKVMFNTLVR